MCGSRKIINVVPGWLNTQDSNCSKVSVRGMCVCGGGENMFYEQPPSTLPLFPSVEVTDLFLWVASYIKKSLLFYNKFSSSGMGGVLASQSYCVNFQTKWLSALVRTSGRVKSRSGNPHHGHRL